MTVLRLVLRGTHAEMERQRELKSRPRTDVVAEKAVATDRFEATGGPFSSYERRLEITPEPRPTATAIPAPTPTDETRSGTTEQESQESQEHCELVETITYRLAVPTWAWLFHFPVKRALKRRQDTYSYWWAPPDRLDPRAATVLGLLCTLQVLDGYLGSVLSQTLTFAADEFGHGNTAQGVVLAAVRVGVLIALVTVALADRHGRRRLLLAAGFASSAVTLLGAASPTLWLLGATQFVARGLSTAMGILIVIMAAEEMPARSRAWAMSVLVLCAGLGSGVVVWVLPVADVHESAWRIVYVVPVLGIAAMAWAARRLPESLRFEAATTNTPPVADSNAASADARLRQRLGLLAAAAFLIAMFAAPASGLRNDFLKDELDYSAAAISLFTVVTSTPIGLGVLIGGYLADRRGRRPVGAAGLVLGTTLIAAAYFTEGFGLWALTLAGGVLGAIAVPALAVYGPELFGTFRRGRANGTIAIVGVTGSALGSLIAGWLSDSLGGQLAPALGLLAAGPLVVAVLVLWKFPETSGQELEELNPEDRPFSGRADV